MLRGIPGQFASHFGLKCSSFCKMNIGTSRRSPCTSLGFEDFLSVLTGNMLLERMGWYCGKMSLNCFFLLRLTTFNYFKTAFRSRSCLLILLCTCLDGLWTFEQPSGSLAEYYPAFRYVLNQVFDCGGPTAVRAPLHVLRR